MRRGSTPTFSFILPANTSVFSNIEILFVQNGTVILTVDQTDLTLDGNEVSFVMTEEQSMAFSPASNGEIQIRLVAQDGTVLISEIRTFPIRKKYSEDLL